MKNTFTALTVVAMLSGCALTPQEIQSASTQKLCRVYAAPLNDNYLSPDVGWELQKRGAYACLDPNVIASRQQAAYNMMALGAQMMEASRPLPPPPPPQQLNCTSTVWNGTIQTHCQ